MIHRCQIQLLQEKIKTQYHINVRHKVTFALSVEIHVAKHNCRIQMNISDSTHAYSRHNERHSRETYSMVASWHNTTYVGDKAYNTKAKPQNMIRAWMKFDSLLKCKTISIYVYQVLVFLFLLYAELWLK